ncbi:ribose-phosphate diphosphokinase [Candidatus Bathyarchaeota archaeon]|nr:ribose-phosphate diphosphokinase [Candidatus Bathyarchaeota archaeon]
MRVILGPSSKELGQKIAALVKVEETLVTFKTFSDGESYIRLEDPVKNEDVVIVETTSPPQDKKLINLVLIADAAKRGGARKVIAVVPYLAYSRQDRVFLNGETVSINVIARMLMASGIDKLITVNVHSQEALTSFPFPAESLSAIPLLADYFIKNGFEKPFALAPDKGAKYIVEEAKKVLGGECGYLEKQRDRYTGQVNVNEGSFNVKGEVVIVFDDIISTGGTIMGAAKNLKNQGAKKVYVACVHPLLIGDAKRRILESGVEEIIGTDSVPSCVSKVSLAPLISGKLKELDSG